MSAQEQHNGGGIIGNMAYCRMRNTLGDLRECYTSINEEEDLSTEEEAAKAEIIELCATIVERFGKGAKK